MPSGEDLAPGTARTRHAAHLYDRFRADHVVGYFRQWVKRKEGGEPTKHAGALDGIEISRYDAEQLIMQARVKAGWITEGDLAKQHAAPESAEAPTA